MTTKEEDNFLRIIYLHFQVATPALRWYFDSIHPNLVLDLSSQQNKKVLSDLYKPPPRKKKLLNQGQWNILYPPPGSNQVSSENLDVTLMVCLLRNLPTTVSAPATGFDILPHSSDKSDGAHIARIKYYKNEYVSHSKDGKLSDANFARIWGDLEMAIHGLGNQQHVSDAVDAKSKVLDYESVKRLMNYDDIIYQRLESEACNIQENRKRLNDHAIELAEHHAKILKLETPVQGMETDIQKLTDDVEQLKTDQTRDSAIGRHTTKIHKNKQAPSKPASDNATPSEPVSDNEANKTDDQSDSIESESREDTDICDHVYHSDTPPSQSILQPTEAITKTTTDINLMIIKLQQWKKDEEYFVETTASRNVMSCLQDTKCLSVVGPPGVGKTFLVQHVALEMEKIGFNIISISATTEIKMISTLNKKTLFVVDDMCGNFTANAARLDLWKNKLKDLNYMLDKDTCKLILTCRLQVFQDEGFNHSDLKLFQTCICNLTDNKLALTNSDKLNLAAKYFDTTYTNELERLYEYEFFPLLCKFYKTSKDKPSFSLDRFLKDPFDIFQTELDNLFVDSKEGKYKFSALLLLVVCNNQLKKKVLEGKKLVKTILKECGINERLSVKSLISILNTLTGSYLENENGVYRTIHDKLFDFLVRYFGTKNEKEFIELLIKHADKNIIRERFLIIESGECDETESEEYVITIQDDDLNVLQMYTERVFDDMTKADEYLWSNRNLNIKAFMKTFITFIKELKKSNILHLIKDTTSLFVRGMFVMDANDLTDLTTHFPCGIMLDHEHLKEFFERIFRDMTKSDDIRNYISKCRCCRNERFRTELRTYMLKLSRDTIQELINSASSCFVQLMFIMKEKDIKQSVYSSKSFHESYGIVIPKDVISMYLERVCNEMTSCSDVVSYISGLRCSRNVDFNTALHRFMNDRPFIRIEELKEVSISFRQIMCVITEGSIKHKSPHVYQRYGFKIPCIMTTEYIERVFDDISNSLDVNKLINYNRNRENPIFKTKLLGYMDQLGEAKIKHLIEFASQDFIDRLCVMTVDEIKDNSKLEFERYGVVIPVDYRRLYIARVFDALKKSDTTENYLKHNRNNQTKTFQTSLRSYIEQLQKDEICNLIQTASSNFLNKWFVTKKEDIKIDSIIEYEQYGIIIQGDNLQIYNERILTLMKKEKYCIRDMNCNRNTRCMFTDLSQVPIFKITGLIETASIQTLQQMIIVDVKNELEEEQLEYHCPDNAVQNISKVKEKCITCPDSVIQQYIDRMISDWRKGYVYAVIENINMKNKSFRQTFFDHLNRLVQVAPSMISDLVNGINQEVHTDISNLTWYGGEYNMVRKTLTVCCIYGDVNLAKWCVDSHCHGNIYEKQYKMCALFMLVVFNNRLKEKSLINEEHKVKYVIMSFGRNHLHGDIPGKLLRDVLDTSMHGIVVKINDVYRVVNSYVFNYLFIYFGSIQHMSNILIKYGDVKNLYEAFLVENRFKHWVGLPDTELQKCIERVFEYMSESKENIKDILDLISTTDIEALRYTLDISNHKIVQAIITYNGNLKRDQIEILFENACVEFLNNLVLIAKEETKYDIDDIFKFGIEIPDVCVDIYVKSVFENISKSTCVEACLNENINKKNKTFHATLSTYLNAITRDEVEILIREASSDFISRMLVISEEDIKDESFWESERYGIVVPESLLPKYIERVFSDIKKSEDVPENRNNENRIFRDTFFSHIRSYSEDKLISLIKTASSKCISHMFLSTAGDFNDISSHGRECYFMFVPRRLLTKIKQHIYETLNELSFSYSNSMKRAQIDVLRFSNNSPNFTFHYYSQFTYYGSILLAVSFKNEKKNDNLHRYPTTQLLDQFLTSKTIKFCVKSTKSIVDKYIKRMLKDWTNGKVHDVFGNINLSNPSFQCKFIYYLKNTAKAKQTKLAKTNDIATGDSPLAVCCYVGILELAEWCLENNSNTNSENRYGERPLYIACHNVHNDIVSCLLNHKHKADVNKRTGITKVTPLYEACERGLTTIFLRLLKEDVDVNYTCLRETALFAACKHGRIEIVRNLLIQKEDTIYINEVKQDYRYNYGTPLYIACKGGHTEIVSLLFNHTAEEVDVNKGTPEGETPLYAACEGGYTDIVDLLLARHGITVIDKNRIDGASPLLIACQEGHVEVVSTLLKNTIIEIDQCMLIGMSPLFIASLLGHTEIVKNLLEKKADVSRYVNNKEIVMQVFEKFKRFYRKPKTLDFVKYVKYIRKLVSEKASEDVQSYIDVKDKDWVFNSILGASPLHMGSLMGHTGIVKLLVKRNSNINSLSENGSTPLFLACELGHEHIVHVLLANGADPTLDGQDGKSPLTIAEDNGHVEIVEFIKSQNRNV